MAPALGGDGDGRCRRVEHPQSRQAFDAFAIGEMRIDEPQGIGVPRRQGAGLLDALRGVHLGRQREQGLDEELPADGIVLDQQQSR